MTAVFAVLLVLGAVVLCAVAWHTRHPGAPGVPDRENGALPAWDPAELQEWNVERKKTKSTPPWLPAAASGCGSGGQGGVFLVWCSSRVHSRSSAGSHAVSAPFSRSGTPGASG